ncbi:16S rRNA (adenine(1518)-N(6)/adenine(1519)-N(6))-dimethyltransferase RsmA [uncultured Tyzzerella sp.]|uniref:16S rRNA (adenine(1518)-N(6)/adenine(1519)-N(6))- dimethyltransferase RsmA n=1 Tax=uncultured Tyzzerella sp. TaxID=2321398 RepID=UPI0029434115|nr:16S rRNA (adenine(1518)-N(6)/adenine(1519)-N(6))-dimethyltransferase RsmA [uncultured Tyzzerella sp.]
MNNTENNKTLAFKTKEIINKYDFAFKKNFGQNFLIDQLVLDKIVSSANISDKDIVIEVGPGIGTLTACLAKNAKKVIAVEIDKTLIPILQDTLSNFDNIEIINEDILKVDIKKIAEKNKGYNIKVVANLPYYITTPIIMNILENRLPIDSITVMIQKEVAYRMEATPGTKDYGSLSVIVQYFCEPYLVANVPRNCFMPRPNVDSAVIRLTTLDTPPVDVDNLELFYYVIKVAFSQRRKTLLNCIFNAENFKFDKEKIAKILEEAGFDVNIRGERLTIEDFANLTKVIEKYL